MLLQICIINELIVSALVLNTTMILGAGASSSSDQHSSKISNRYQNSHEADIEYKCSSNYYDTNMNEYREVFTTAVKENDLVVLHLLMSGISAKTFNNILPLHITAKFYSLDCMEVLVWAGFSPSKRDKYGQTPLHICARSSCEDAVLCCTFLCLQDKEAIGVKDHLTGSTPLHVAAGRSCVSYTLIFLFLIC